MLDTARLDRLYQYILATARQLDDFRQRELGPIHLLKYAYLADLDYASAGLGSFTGIDWRFFHFGPWSEEAFARIDPALTSAAATKKMIASRFADDFVRYTFDDQYEAERLARKIEEAIPITIAGAVAAAVQQHGSDTADLLRHVYLTAPMLRATPGEALVLEAATARTAAPPVATMDRKTSKAREIAIEAARTAVMKRLAEREEMSAEPEPPPRYDEVFFEGTAQLDKLAGTPPVAETGVVEFEDSIWASEQRREPEVS